MTNNRKSHTPFRLVPYLPKSTILDDLERLFSRDSSLWQYEVYVTIRESSLETKRGLLVSVTIKFMRIFAGVLW